MDLSSMVMLKDNHIWSTGSITESVSRARVAIEAGEAGADVIMLDNYEGDALKAVSGRIKQRWPHIIIEASGGITLETMPQYFAPSVDIISQGALTNGYDTLDYSLKVPKPETFAKRGRVQA